MGRRWCLDIKTSKAACSAKALWGPLSCVKSESKTAQCHSRNDWSQEAVLVQGSHLSWSLNSMCYVCIHLSFLCLASPLATPKQPLQKCLSTSNACFFIHPLCVCVCVGVCVCFRCILEPGSVWAFCSTPLSENPGILRAPLPWLLMENIASDINIWKLVRLLYKEWTLGSLTAGAHCHALSWKGQSC